MEINYKIVYREEVINIDIPKLDNRIRELIKYTINKKLTKNPEFFGKQLRRSLSGARKLRIGNYRVIFEISKNRVIIWAIGHRSKIYFIVNNRFK